MHLRHHAVIEFIVHMAIVQAFRPTARISSRSIKRQEIFRRLSGAVPDAHPPQAKVYTLSTRYSHGKGKEGFILGACRQGICFVPVILILPMVWGLNGILYAQPVADVLSAIITVFMAAHLYKELKAEEKQYIAIKDENIH